MTVLLVAVLAGVAEEPGWRGDALHGLVGRFRVVTAALIVGAAWSLWHLPPFFIEGRTSTGSDSGPWRGELIEFVVLTVLAIAVTVGWRRLKLPPRRSGL